jgi:hypothetical protein
MSDPTISYTDRARAAVLDAVGREHDFGGWLAIRRA